MMTRKRSCANCLGMIAVVLVIMLGSSVHAGTNTLKRLPMQKKVVTTKTVTVQKVATTPKSLSVQQKAATTKPLAVRNKPTSILPTGMKPKVVNVAQGRSTRFLLPIRASATKARLVTMPRQGREVDVVGKVTVTPGDLNAAKTGRYYRVSAALNSPPGTYQLQYSRDNKWIRVSTNVLQVKIVAPAKDSQAKTPTKQKAILLAKDSRARIDPSRAIPPPVALGKLPVTETKGGVSLGSIRSGALEGARTGAWRSDSRNPGMVGNLGPLGGDAGDQNQKGPGGAISLDNKPSGADFQKTVKGDIPQGRGPDGRLMADAGNTDSGSNDAGGSGDTGAGGSSDAGAGGSSDAGAGGSSDAGAGGNSGSNDQGTVEIKQSDTDETSSDGSMNVSSTVTVNGSDGSTFSHTVSQRTDSQGNTTVRQEVSYTDSNGNTSSENSCSGYACRPSDEDDSCTSPGCADLQEYASMLMRTQPQYRNWYDTMTDPGGSEFGTTATTIKQSTAAELRQLRKTKLNPYIYPTDDGGGSSGPTVSSRGGTKVKGQPVPVDPEHGGTFVITPGRPLPPGSGPDGEGPSDGGGRPPG